MSDVETALSALRDLGRVAERRSRKGAGSFWDGARVDCFAGLDVATTLTPGELQAALDEDDDLQATLEQFTRKPKARKAKAK